MPYTALGIIPARGGSKGVRRKNVRIIAGRPLIAYTIEAARNSRCLTRFIVSTDDQEIEAAARECGCEVIQRPAELAQDHTPMVPVVRHALAVAEDSADRRYDYGVVLQPTTPLRTAEDIDRGLELLTDGNADSVVAVYEVRDHHPSRMYRIEGGVLVPFASEYGSRLRQELPPLYHRNGALYAFRRSLLDEAGDIIGPRTLPLIMPRDRSVNIDEEIDLLLAELLLRRARNHDTNPER